MAMVSPKDLLSELDRHEMRRRATPTVSTLVGPIGAVIHHWRNWSAEQGRGTIILHEPGRTPPAAAWVRGVVANADLPSIACEYLARHLEKPLEQVRGSLSNATRYALETMCATLPDSAQDFGAGAVCRWVLEREILGESIDADAFFDGLDERFAAPGSSDAVNAILDFYGERKAPTLLIVDGAPRGDASASRYRLEELARAVVSLAVAAPSLTVGAAVSRDEFEDYLAASEESFFKAALREQCVVIEAVGSEEIRSALTRLCAAADDYEPAIEQLVNHGASPALVESFVEVAAIASSPDTPLGEKDKARSAYERFLYELLEHAPDLAGLFELGVQPGFLFGNRPAELDLACRSLGIAVEVDGYYHFTDPQNYRRDRRKDFELQRNGYLVLRFLTEDVLGEMESVLETIRAAVRFRRGAEQ